MGLLNDSENDVVMRAKKMLSAYSPFWEQLVEQTQGFIRRESRCANALCEEPFESMAWPLCKCGETKRAMRRILVEMVPHIPFLWCPECGTCVLVRPCSEKEWLWFAPTGNLSKEPELDDSIDEVKASEG